MNTPKEDYPKEFKVVENYLFEKLDHKDVKEEFNEWTEFYYFIKGDETEAFGPFTSDGTFNLYERFPEDTYQLLKRYHFNEDRHKYRYDHYNRLKKLEEIVKDVLKQTGDKVCWLDVYTEMAELVGVKFNPELLPKEKFLGNCSHFHDCLKKGEPYETPE